VKTARNILLFAGVALAVMQFLPVKRVSGEVVPSHTIEANLDVPPAVETILNKACKDCHSHETHLPWYGKVAPVSWLVAGDIERARRAMNLSEWSVQTGARPAAARGTLLAACSGVEAQRMPPASYRQMHPEARLTVEEVDALCGWTAAAARVLRKHAASRRTVALIQ